MPVFSLPTSPVSTIAIHGAITMSEPLSVPGAEISDIREKHGSTMLRTLRRIYGDGFAMGSDPHVRLRDLAAEVWIRRISPEHLDLLWRDHTAKVLAAKIAKHF